MKETVRTMKYFQDQLLEFRTMMGNKPDWEMSDDGLNRKIDLAFKGLVHLYANTNEISDDYRILMDATIIEFQHRKMLMETLERTP